MRLGGSGLLVPAMGVGAMSWGVRSVGYGTSHSFDDVFRTYRACLDTGLDFFDTAQMYGAGESERVLGDCLRRDGRPVIIATKFAPSNVLMPNRRHVSPASMGAALDGSLERLGVDCVDLYQLHMPAPHRRLDGFLDALAGTVVAGKARAVGVCNFTASLIRHAHERLASHGVPLASAMVGYNLLRRYPEANGVVEACRELDIGLIAYAPLAEGVLTGKYRAGGRVPRAYRLLMRLEQVDPYKERGRSARPWKLFSKPRTLDMPRLEPLFKVLEETAALREKTIAQVALRWIMDSTPTIIPIPGAKNPSQLQDNIGALGWRLAKEEHEAISRAEMACRSNSC